MIDGRGQTHTEAVNREYIDLLCKYPVPILYARDMYPPHVPSVSHTRTRTQGEGENLLRRLVPVAVPVPVAAGLVAVGPVSMRPVAAGLASVGLTSVGLAGPEGNSSGVRAAGPSPKLPGPESLSGARLLFFQLTG